MKQGNGKPEKKGETGKTEAQTASPSTPHTSIVLGLTLEQCVEESGSERCSLGKDLSCFPLSGLSVSEIT